MKLATIWLSSLLLLAGCTVIPETVRDLTPSFDGGAQNSGFYGYDNRGNGYLTPRARDRYNLLIAQFGARYLPPLKADDGISPGVPGEVLFDGRKIIGIAPTNAFKIDPEHLVDFREMNRWKKARPQ